MKKKEYTGSSLAGHFFTLLTSGDDLLKAFIIHQGFALFLGMLKVKSLCRKWIHHGSVVRVCKSMCVDMKAARPAISRMAIAGKYFELLLYT